MNGERSFDATAITIAKGIATIPAWGWYSGQPELAERSGLRFKGAFLRAFEFDGPR